MTIHRKFVRVKLYTFKRDVGAFRTATIYKDGAAHSIMAAADANEFCEKWNGRRGDFEVKPTAR